MSGVLSGGVQYEKCNDCISYVPIRKMYYEQPSEQHKFGRDLCERCALDEWEPGEKEDRKGENLKEMRRIAEQIAAENAGTHMHWTDLPSGGSQGKRIRDEDCTDLNCYARKG